MGLVNARLVTDVVMAHKDGGIVKNVKAQVIVRCAKEKVDRLEGA